MVDGAGNSYGPYDIEVAGSSAEPFTEAAWYQMQRESGVLFGAGLTFAGLTAQVAPFASRVKGSFLSRTAQWTDASPATPSGGNPRRDLLVARRQLTAGSGGSAVPGKTFLTVLRGTPAASPADPAFDAVNDEPLWSWQVPGNGGTVVTAVRDLRQFLDLNTGIRFPPAITAYRSVDQGIGSGTASGTVVLNQAAAGAHRALPLNAATGEITIGAGEGGPFEVSGALSLIQNGAAGAAGVPMRLYVAVAVNGTEVHRGLDQHARSFVVGDLLGRVLPTCRLDLVDGDKVKFIYFHDSAAAATIAPGAGITEMYLRRVA